MLRGLSIYAQGAIQGYRGLSNAYETLYFALYAPVVAFYPLRHSRGYRGIYTLLGAL
jgi:hypothetical protein